MPEYKTEEQLLLWRVTKKQTFAERFQAVAPQVKHQGAFYGYIIEPHKDGKKREYVLTARLTPYQVPNLEGMKLTYIHKDFTGVAGRNREQIQKLMGTSIRKELGVLRFYFPNQMCVDYSSKSSLIFTDLNFDLSEYEEILRNQSVDITEAKQVQASNAWQVPNFSLLRKTFSDKHKTGGVVYYPGGRRSGPSCIEPKSYHPHHTKEPTNVRTFEVLGKTKHPWNEPNVREAFAKILDKDLMDERIKLIEVKFTNQRDVVEILFDSFSTFADVKDVLENRDLLRHFVMKRKISVGKENATVIYYKLGYETELKGYFLRVYGKSKRVIEKAILKIL